MSDPAIAAFAFIPGSKLPSGDMPRGRDPSNDAFHRELERAHSALTHREVRHLPGRVTPAPDFEARLRDLTPRGIHFMDEVVAFLEGWGEVTVQTVNTPAEVSFIATFHELARVAPNSPAKDAAGSSTPLPESLGVDSYSPNLSGSTRNPQRTELHEEADSVPAAVARQDLPPQPAVRVHAEWTAEGVRIWLGMNAAGTGQPQALVGQLQRWLATQGVRCLSITCNGQTLVEECASADTPTSIKERT